MTQGKCPQCSTPTPLSVTGRFQYCHDCTARLLPIHTVKPLLKYFCPQCSIEQREPDALMRTCNDCYRKWISSIPNERAGSCPQCGGPTMANKFADRSIYCLRCVEHEFNSMSVSDFMTALDEVITGVTNSVEKGNS